MTAAKQGPHAWLCDFKTGLGQTGFGQTGLGQTGLGLLLLLCGLCVSGPAWAQDSEPSFGDQFSKVGASLKPWLVKIGPVEKLPTDPRGLRALLRPPQPGQPGPKLEKWTSTGLLIEDGLVLTAKPAVAGLVNNIPFESSTGLVSSASVLATDHYRGVCLLKCPGLKSPGAVPWHGKGSLSVGQFCVVLGRAPNSGGHSLHLGILSAQNRFRQKFLQTDARTHKGCWGGPVVDLKGRVLGLVIKPKEQPKENAGVTFAITAQSLLKEVLPSLKKGQDIQPPKPSFLGVYVEAKRVPLKITRVLKGSAAEKAGLKPGDELHEVGGFMLRNSQTLRGVLNRLAPGTKSVLLVVRGDKRMRLPVQLTEAEKMPPKPTPPARRGVPGGFPPGLLPKGLPGLPKVPAPKKG